MFMIAAKFYRLAKAAATLAHPDCSTAFSAKTDFRRPFHITIIRPVCNNFISSPAIGHDLYSVEFSFSVAVAFSTFLGCVELNAFSTASISVSLV